MNTSLLVAIAMQAFSSPLLSPVSFDEALSKRQISAHSFAGANSSHYQQPVMLEIKNLSTTSLSVEIPVGRLFVSTDTTDQSFVSTEPILVSLQPGQSKELPVSAMCVNHHKSAPSTGVAYTVKKQASDKLVKTAQYIHQNKLYGTYLGQTVMWCASDNEPLDAIFGYDESGAKEAVGFMAALLGKPVPAPPAADDYLRNPRAKPKVSVGGSFEFQFSRSKAVHIAMFDGQNIAVRELYNNPNEAPGEHKVDFEFDASVYNGGVYYIRFLCDNRILMEQEMQL